MPPPATTNPASKPIDPTDLADALTSAGIDLKEEEARLASGGNYTAQYNGYPGMPLSQEEANRQELRKRASVKANHLHDPFLNAHILSNRLLNKTQNEGCAPFTIGDLSMPVHKENMDIVALLSLACRERLTSLLSRSTALARVRRRPQTHITGEWADRVMGVTPDIRPGAPPDSANSLPSAVSPGSSFLKREHNPAFCRMIADGNPRITGSFSAANGAAPVSGGGIPTANLQNETAIALRQLKQKEWEADQERQRKKARREQPPGVASTPGAGGDSTPGTPGGDLPGIGERKFSAKEIRKQASNKTDEADSHRAANATANMMMGGFGGFGGLRKKKKTYAWMTGMTPGGNAPGGGCMGGPVRPGPVGAIDTSVGQINTSPELGNLTWTGQRLGVWREDGERGKAIQIRDWVGALEGDGRVARKGIVKAYLRMK